MTPHIYPGLYESDKMEYHRGNVFGAVRIALGISKDEMLSKSRKRPVMDALCIAVHFMSGLSQYNIGIAINRDRSTVSVTMDKFKDLYGTNKSFTEKVNKVKEVLKNGK